MNTCRHYTKKEIQDLLPFIKKYYSNINYGAKTAKKELNWKDRSWKGIAFKMRKLAQNPNNPAFAIGNGDEVLLGRKSVRHKSTKKEALLKILINDLNKRDKVQLALDLMSDLNDEEIVDITSKIILQ